MDMTIEFVDISPLTELMTYSSSSSSLTFAAARRLRLREERKGKRKWDEGSTLSSLRLSTLSQATANLFRAFLAWLSGGDGEGVRLLLRRSRRPGGRRWWWRVNSGDFTPARYSDMHCSKKFFRIFYCNVSMIL